MFQVNQSAPTKSFDSIFHDRVGNDLLLNTKFKHVVILLEMFLKENGAVQDLVYNQSIGNLTNC